MCLVRCQCLQAHCQVCYLYLLFEWVSRSRWNGDDVYWHGNPHVLHDKNDYDGDGGNDGDVGFYLHQNQCAECFTHTERKMRNKQTTVKMNEK